ncbi:putative two-component response regulator [Mobilicoccus pelagius NBRC 104925]|uniref:Putative two-component response regulator n=1 Tax=Mobilicoccus pelagius NBRC 104925 TaxID=1089455 RepID=H5UUJ9_9MICO|nr:putative two-component response regulator [Mobilicoccus pelagius NBRC 104925]
MAQVGGGAEAGERVTDGDIDLAVLDVSIPRMTGRQTAREITRRGLPTELLMFSMHDNEQYLFEALENGASGHVHKSVAVRNLVEACRSALRDEPFLYAARPAGPRSPISPTRSRTVAVITAPIGRGWMPLRASPATCPRRVGADTHTVPADIHHAPATPLGYAPVRCGCRHRYR